MIITPSMCLLHCPMCSEKLIIEKMFSSKETYCDKCGYSEPAGSAHFVTFVVEVLVRFIQNLNIKQVVLGSEHFTDFRSVLESNTILPALLINARLNTEHVGTKLSAIPLTTVSDVGGFYKCRVVTTTSNINNPSICIAAMTETLYSTYLLSMENPTLKEKRSLDLSLLSPVSAMQIENVKSFASLQGDMMIKTTPTEMERS